MKSEEKMQMTFNEICSAEANDTILSPSVSAKPFIKWAGGKGQLLPEIRKAFPKELGRSIKKYAEPFIGGGAVLFEVLNNYKLEEVYISDVNSELIGTYTSIRDDCDAIVDLLNKYEMQYLPLPDDESRRKLFYRFRDRYNELKLNPLDSNTVNVQLCLFS